MLNLQLTSLPMMCILVIAMVVVTLLGVGVISEQVIFVPFASVVTFSVNITDLSGRFMLPLRAEIINIVDLILIGCINEELLKDLSSVLS